MVHVLKAKNVRKIKFIVALTFGLTSAVALGETRILSTQPSWFEHVDLMQVVIGVLFVITGWFLVYTLKKIDDNQSEIFRRLIKLEKSNAELWGEHRIAVSNHIRQKENENELGQEA